MPGMSDESDVLKDAMRRLGAREFLRKPFGEKELIRHVSRTLHETQGGVQTRLAIGPVAVEFRTKEAFVDDANVCLTAMEFDLLAYLMRESPCAVPWQEIERCVWGWDESRLSCKEPPTIHVILCRLRRKLGRAAACLCVQRGVGLQFRIR